MKMKRRLIFKKIKKIFNKKEITVILFSIISFISCLYLTSHIIYKDREIEVIELNAIYSKHLPNDRTTDVKIQIIKPENSISQPDPLPACILIHGDKVGPEAMNMVIKELIDNGYLVAVTDFKDFDPIPTLSKLEAILDYLLQRADVNSEQIGVFGHSRGGLFALLFGMIRENNINAVVCGNFADWEKYSFMSSYLNISIDYKPNINSTVPNNVLFTLDENDDRSGRNSDEFLYNLTDGQFIQPKQFFGNFSTGTAREVYYSSTIFSHISALYSSYTIHKEIKWLNQALNHISGGNGTQIHTPGEIRNFIQTIFFLIFVECFLAYHILKNIIFILSYQDLIIQTVSSYIVKKVNSWKKKKTKIEHIYQEISHQSKHKQEIVSDSAQRDYQERIWLFYKTVQKEDAKFLSVCKNDKELFQENKLTLMKMEKKKFWMICFKYLAIIWGSALLFKTGLAFILENASRNQDFIFIFINSSFKPTLLIFDDFFRFNYMTLYLIVFFIITNSILRKQPELKKLGEYSKIHSLKGILISFEIYLFFTYFLSEIFYDISGDLAPSFDLRNIIIILPLFYFVNLFTFEFFYNRISGTNNEKLKSIGIQLCIYVPFLIPEIFFNQVFPEFYIGLFVAIILNPTIYKYFKNFKMIAFFDYLFMVSIFSYLHF